MSTIGCIFRNTQAYNDLKDLVEFLGFQLLGSDKKPTVGTIFHFIREQGIEVDLQTVGQAYTEVLPRNDQNFQSTEEVNEFVLNNYRNAVQRASKIRNVKVTKELGADKSELHTVMGILNMFFKANTTTRETKSVHVQMQEALWKGIQRKLDIPMKSRPKTLAEWKPILEQALGFEKLGITDLQGKLNSIADLFDAMQEQLETATEDLSEIAKPVAMARWENAIQALRGTAYSLLLSQGEARNMLTSLMKDAGFTKEVNVPVTPATPTGKKTVFDWTKLAGEASTIDDVRANVEKVLQDAGYSQRVIDAVKDSLESEMNDLVEENIQKQLDQTERIGREGTKYTLDDAGFQAALGGQKEAEWIRTEDIENIEDLEAKANALLAGKKYIPAVRKEIVDRLKDFFTRNYAKVVSREAKEAVRDMLGGQTALEWIMENGIQNQQELYDALAAQLSNRQMDPAHMQEIANEFLRILDINDRSQRALTSRGKALGRVVDQKTDIRRLAELYNLGLFDTGQHRAVLYNLLGVPDLVVQDIEDLEAISQAAANLFRKVDKELDDQIFATREFQFLQRHIDRIVARNINNKTKLLKILGGIRAFFDLFLSGLLSGPFTILENMWSGMKVGMSTFTGGAKTSKEDLEIYRKMLQDVTITGQAYGEEVGSFAPRELFSNMLAWKWKGATAAEKAQSMLYLMHMPGRVGLLAFDSANKVFTTNKVFKHAIYQSLTQQGFDRASTLNFMNSALNGQSFEQAKKQAEEILNQVNSSLPQKYQRRVTDATITTLANDLVKANLTANQVLSTELVREAYKGAYHVAGYGLGHEANNFISKQIELLRKHYKMKEEQLIKDKDWKGLAVQRMIGMIVNNIIIKFAGGATNWIWLRFQEAGLGLATGFLGKWNHDIDFDDKNSIRKSIQDIHLARHKIGRATVGITAGIVAYTLMYLLKGDDEDDKETAADLEEKINGLKGLRGEKLQEALIMAGIDGVTKENATEKKNELLVKWHNELKQAEARASFYKRIKANWMLKRGFLKMAPDVMLLNYFMDTEPNAFMGALKYVQQTTGIASPYSADEKFNDAIKMAKNDDFGGAQGALASIVGSSFGVPMWRAYKDWGKMARWIGGEDVQSDFREPTNFVDGLLGGGMLEDLGVYSPRVRITMLSGIGMKTYNRFKERGISTMEDIKNNPEWYKLKYTDENGKEQFILAPADQVKAKQEAQDYLKEELE